MPDGFEPLRRVSPRPHVHALTTRHQAQVVEHRHDAAPRLVDRAHHRPVRFNGESFQRFHHSLRLERVQAARRFVATDDVRGPADELARQRESLLLAAGDAAGLDVADFGVGDVRDAHGSQRGVDGFVSIGFGES